MPATPTRSSRRRPSVAAARDAIRREIFAQLSQLRNAGPIEVSVRAIEERLAQAHRASKRRWPTLRPDLLHVRDAALATACVNRCAGAWEALVAEHEHALIAAAMWLLDEEQAILTARRLLIELRRSVAGDARTPAMGLRLYRADRPLREWLLERLTGRIAVGAIAPASRDGGKEARVLGRVRRAGRAGLHLGRDRRRRRRQACEEQTPPPPVLPFPSPPAASPAPAALPWVVGGEGEVVFDRDSPASPRLRSV